MFLFADHVAILTGLGIHPVWGIVFGIVVFLLDGLNNATPTTKKPEPIEEL